jgi:hypothetical protein
MSLDVDQCFLYKVEKTLAVSWPHPEQPVYLKKRPEMFLHPDLKNASTTSTNLLPRPMSRSVNSTASDYYVTLDKGQLADSGWETGFMSNRVSVFLVYYISNNYSLILH